MAASAITPDSQSADDWSFHDASGTASFSRTSTAALWCESPITCTSSGVMDDARFFFCFCGAAAAAASALARSAVSGAATVAAYSGFSADATRRRRIALGGLAGSAACVVS